jgi:hypothetical protein
MNNNNNRSPPLTPGEICIISPVGLSPGEMIPTAELDRSLAPGLTINAARRGFANRNLSACRPDRRRIVPTW